MLTKAPSLACRYERVPCLTKARSNDEAKEAWTNRTLWYAKRVVAEDAKLYDFGSQLSRARLLQHWGSQDAIDGATQQYVKKCLEVDYPDMSP